MKAGFITTIGSDYKVLTDVPVLIHSEEEPLIQFHQDIMCAIVVCKFFMSVVVGVCVRQLDRRKYVFNKGRMQNFTWPQILLFRQTPVGVGGGGFQGFQVRPIPGAIHT